MTSEQLEEEWLSARQVADLLKVHKTTVFKWVTEGLLKAYKPGGRVIRVKRTDLNEMLEEFKKKPRTGPHGGQYDP